MKIRFLGSGGYHPNERRHTACLLIAELGIVLDAGTGMFRLAKYLTTNSLDVFLSHAHLDHVVGLTYLLGILYGREMQQVTIHGDGEKLAAIQQHLFTELLFPKMPPIRFQPLDGPLDVEDGGRLTYFPLEHPGGVLGYRLDWPDSSLAYVTDTTATPDAPYIEQIRGVDLLVHECYFPDSMQQLATESGHSWASAVADIARRAGAGELILVHINPAAERDDEIGLDAARAVFPKTRLGEDGMEVEF